MKKQAHLLLSGLITLALVACSPQPTATGESTHPAETKPASATPPETLTVNWGAETVLSGRTGSVHKAYGNANAIAVDQQGIVHAVWYAIKRGADEIHYRRSLDNGLTWEKDMVIAAGPNFVSEVMLTTTSGLEIVAGSNGGANPALAVAGTNVYVVWRNDLHSSQESGSKALNGEIYFLRSADSGETWEADIRLTETTDNSLAPAAAADGNRVAVTWIDVSDENGDLYYRASEDYGVHWTDEMRLTKTPGNEMQPTISIQGDNVVIFWMDDRDGNWEIYYLYSQDGGRNWSAPIRFSNDPGVSEVPAIACSGSEVHAVWADSRTKSPDEHYIDAYEIYYRMSSDGGATWSEEIRLTDAPKWSADPSIAVLGQSVFVFWPDRRDMPGSGREDDREIYYKYSLNGGKTWSDDFRLTNSSGDSSIPAIALTNSFIHLLWEDARRGESEMYYSVGEILRKP